MAKKKSGLGSGLDSIFDDNIDLLGEDAAGGAITSLHIGEIEPNRSQPRKEFDADKLNALAQSIAENGIIQPLTVRRLDSGAYQIVAGERRWRAAQIAGLSTVPVRVMELTDKQTMAIALIENLQREDLNPVEEALGYQELMERFGMKQDDVAKKVGKARSSVANSLRLISLPDTVKEMLKKGELSGGHAKVLLGLSDSERITALAKKCVEDGLSVRTLEKLVKLPAEKPEKPIPRRSSFYVEAEISLKDLLGSNVKISEGKKKSTLEIEFKDEEELKSILHRITGE